VQFSDLKEFVDTKVYQFSSGMVTRLTFSIFIHCINLIHPEILLLDEVIGAGGDIDFTKKWKPEEIYRVFNGKLSKIMSKNFIKNNLSEIKDMIISKYPNTFYLFSLDENPNWETQEILMEVASKYHLG
jgi:ABC-type polysaccharide/polyol phosphate transport system ATPase subunit